MLTASKVHEIELCELFESDIEEIISSGRSGVCRALLTPDVAALLLKNHNFKNRGIKRHHKLFIQRQIESGKFVYNGEAIVIGDNGQVLNGQHRLSACVAARIAIEVLMVFGVPSASFTTLDQCARRGGADVLFIDGNKNCNALAACLRQIDHYFKGAIGKANAPCPNGLDGRGDNSFALVLMEKYPDASESVSRMNGIKLAPLSIASALHYLCCRIDKDQAEEFCSVVLNGYKLGNTYTDIGEAAAMLREWLVRANLGNKKTPPWIIANTWIKAWNAGREGKLPKVLGYKENERVPVLL